MSNHTCFLIDDDLDDREIFAIALESTGEQYTCITATDGIEAIEKLSFHENFIPDFIFLDLNMSPVNGKDCLQNIKNIPHLSNIPVIIYTTSSHKKDMEETQKLGAAHFFTKPSSMSRLKEILSMVLLNHAELPFSLNQEI